jgi:hypothetical protein
LRNPLPGACQAAVALCPNSSLAHEVVAGLESFPNGTACPQCQSSSTLLDQKVKDQMRHIALARGMVLGSIGGLAATVAIDLITIGVVPLMGMPADSGFAIIGDTAAGFLSLLGINVAGVAVTHVDVFHLNSAKQSLGLGILYTEVISLPILVMPPIILKWTTAAAAQWFGFSFVMHAIWGVVLGAVVCYGLGLVTAAKHS